MTKIKIKTKGMHCKSCETLVNDALSELDGVHKAKSNHQTGVIDVEFDKTKTNEERIKSIIRKEGYKVE